MRVTAWSKRPGIPIECACASSANPVRHTGMRNIVLAFVYVEYAKSRTIGHSSKLHQPAWSLYEFTEPTNHIHPRNISQRDHIVRAIELCIYRWRWRFFFFIPIEVASSLSTIINNARLLRAQEQPKYTWIEKKVERGYFLIIFSKWILDYRILCDWVPFQVARWKKNVRACITLLVFF